MDALLGSHLIALDDAHQMSDYTELHLHSNFSLLDGASHIEELASTAAQYEYSSLALTDTNNLYGAMAFGKACRAAGIAPITGAEVTLPALVASNLGPYHLTLLATDSIGYGNLCRIISHAHGYGRPSPHTSPLRRDPSTTAAFLETHSDGLLCLIGCPSSELAHLCVEQHYEKARTLIDHLAGIFGPTSLYIETHINLSHDDRARNDHYRHLAQEAHIPLVATGNVHYHTPERANLHDTLVAIRHSTTLSASHSFRHPNHSFYLRPPHEQETRFARYPGATAATCDIAERCHFDITKDITYSLPSPVLTNGSTPDEELSHICHALLSTRYGDDLYARALSRCEEELGLIRRKNLSGFFLIYRDVMQLAHVVARRVRVADGRGHITLPPGRGRGSSVGSIICYLIGLSHIDPIINNLFLGRFLSEEMTSLPDIDLDFPRDIRAELFEAIYDRWGTDYAALICTFPTYRSRSALRDVGKALDLPPDILHHLSNSVDGYGSRSAIAEEMADIPALSPLKGTPVWGHLERLSHEIYGFPRHVSQHVGGVVISSSPLIEAVPIEPASWQGRYLAQWDKDSIDDAGMVKLDVLSLGMLSAVEECVSLVSEIKGIEVDLTRIDFEDPAVYHRISSADTIGLFQIESRAQASTLNATQPRNLDDLAHQVAIIRPGPVAGGAVRLYVKYRRLLRANPSVHIPMPDERLRPFLGETLGAILYQEQILQCAMSLAGFTAGEAESLRRGMGRTNWPALRPIFEEKFFSGCRVNGVTDEVAHDVFAQMLGFAEYGFPKSHATAFALLAYHSAWLKEYYPQEFYCSLFNQWPMGFYPPHVLIHDAERHGIKALSPHINRSDARTRPCGNDIQLGLMQIKGVGPRHAYVLEQERRAHGDFVSLFDCASRTLVPRDVLEQLIRVGTFEDTGLNARELLWQLGLLFMGENAVARQLSLGLPTNDHLIAFEPPSLGETIATDYSLLGLSARGHPLAHMRPTLHAPPSNHLHHRALHSSVTVVGLVVCRQQPHTAKGVVFLTMEDEGGLINVSISPDLYETNRRVVKGSPVLRVTGTLSQFHGDVPAIRAQAIEPALSPVGAFSSHDWS